MYTHQIGDYWVCSIKSEAITEDVCYLDAPFSESRFLSFRCFLPTCSWKWRHSKLCIYHTYKTNGFCQKTSVFKTNNAYKPYLIKSLPYTALYFWGFDWRSLSARSWWLMPFFVPLSGLKSESFGFALRNSSRGWASRGWASRGWTSSVANRLDDWPRLGDWSLWNFCGRNWLNGSSLPPFMPGLDGDCCWVAPNLPRGELSPNNGFEFSKPWKFVAAWFLCLRLLDWP